MRTEQYRATIRRENQLMKLHQSSNDIEISESQESPNDNKDFFLYDIGRSRVTEFDPKMKRDSYYKFSSSKGRTFNSGLRPVSGDWGCGLEEMEYKAPEYGGHAATQHFFDRSHIHL
jgi:hypothetical protein